MFSVYILYSRFLLRMLSKVPVHFQKSLLAGNVWMLTKHLKAFMCQNRPDIFRSLKCMSIEGHSVPPLQKLLFFHYQLLPLSHLWILCNLLFSSNFVFSNWTFRTLLWASDLSSVQKSRKFHCLKQPNSIKFAGRSCQVIFSSSNRLKKWYKHF